MPSFTQALPASIRRATCSPYGMSFVQTLEFVP
jgi:hypothetical protein